MTTNKLTKYLAKPPTKPTGNKIYTPAVLSDSKGGRLEGKARNSSEREVKFWWEGGRSCKKGYKWLKSNIKSKIRKLGRIWIYVWLGTCDLTTKNKKYVSLTSEGEQAIDKAYEYLLKIKELAENNPKCEITFLEIPVYSIVEWNRQYKHKDPESFQEQDTKLAGL